MTDATTIIEGAAPDSAAAQQPAVAAPNAEPSTTVDDSTLLTGEQAITEGQGDAGEGGDPAASDSSKAGEGDSGENLSAADFALPEGFELDAGFFEKAQPVFQELGLGKEAAQ